MGIRETVLISAAGISKRYRQGRETIAALDDVSLSVRQGELLAVVGPSGSGKTTLAHIVGGLDTPHEGSVEVAGHALKKSSDKQLSRYRNDEVGFVFQDFGLVPHYTVAENVAMPLVIAGIRPRKRRELVEKYLQLVGLEDRASQRASKLSGGERQRVSIARALVNQPKIIIADEPTGSLDSKRGAEIMKVLKLLSRGQGITILMVTHDMTLAAQADRVVHLRDGKIAREDTRATK